MKVADCGRRRILDLNVWDLETDIECRGVAGVKGSKDSLFVPSFVTFSAEWDCPNE